MISPTVSSGVKAKEAQELLPEQTTSDAMISTCEIASHKGIIQAAGF